MNPRPSPSSPLRGAVIPSAAASVALGVAEPNIPGIGRKPIPIVMFGSWQPPHAADCRG